MEEKKEIKPSPVNNDGVAERSECPSLKLAKGEKVELGDGFLFNINPATKVIKEFKVYNEDGSEKWIILDYSKKD